MHNDNRNTGRSATGLFPPTLYRGLYGRIAKRLGVDASYVSRVARGERYSREIEMALRQEIDEITRSLAGGGAPASEEHPGRPKAKRLKNFVARNCDWIRQEFLTQSQSDPGLRRIQIPASKRAAPIPGLLRECMKLMVFTPKQMRTTPVKAAVQHGTLRRGLGFRAADLVEEYNLLRRCVFNLAEKHFSDMDTHLLFHDMSQIDEALDFQLSNALTVFLGEAA